MGCCKHVPAGSIKTARGILPKGLIVPTRVGAFVALLAGAIYVFVNIGNLVSTDFLILIILNMAACALLAECRRSDCYYKAMQEGN